MLKNDKKIRQKGFLKLKFVVIPKKNTFCQNISQAIDEVEFFATFQILGYLGCQGWVVRPENVKK
jgi:hypothetical protein